VTGLSHYILEALDVELLFLFRSPILCASCTLVLKKRGQVLFSFLFPFPRFCACMKRKDAKKQSHFLGEWIVHKVKDPIPHVWKNPV
jgi:hypothetical protein